MTVRAIGKFLDQPLLSNTLSRHMPEILTGGALLFGVKDTFEQPKEERLKRAKRNAIMLGSITLGTILAAKHIKVKGETLVDFISKQSIIDKQTNAVNEFLSKIQSDDKETETILDKAKSKLLNLKETKHILNFIEENKANHKISAEDAKKITETLFGEDKNITSKEIFKEISKLSILGFVPVGSGIIGGILADKAEGIDCKERTTNKIKEGIYQFLANIFLCNVGAGSFLYTAEKLQEKGIIKKLGKLQKTGIILAGILTVGVLGGSCIANFIGNKVVNPIINKITNNKQEETKKETRKPEPLDLALHTDDIATAGVLSGIKWVEPLLPLLYLVSGYRSAIGYRNSGECKNVQAKIAQPNQIQQVTKEVKLDKKA